VSWLIEFSRNRTEPSVMSTLWPPGWRLDGQPEVPVIVVGVDDTVHVGDAVEEWRVRADQGVAKGIKVQPDAPVLAELIMKVAAGHR
jgi:hypothetical protein